MAQPTTQADIDEIWRLDGERNGWSLPDPAPFILRLRGVRLLRASYIEFHLNREAKLLQKQGIGFGKPPQRELWILYGIARGWA